MTNKFTPGKWEVFDWEDRSSKRRMIGVTHADADIAHCSGFYPVFRSHEEELANANLIASAPELLEALEKILLSSKQVGHRYAENIASAAIAKAIGEA